ncbi:hypothetical protein PDESU_03366 [Pontiella desulfatans]|uniref:Sulfatase-modifying factor enzyme-like domain-containing protein n=1 Tax=Pontiella desulfatans TaxID=2750659 RepID=A0A6C2U4Q0_PONDE|nr:SUMF1/EgtB/PvdO family nonheme iron enzyme [Pontiella desulfatans]VGO14797.1 hypothetical protein PDESU_03366 [Pontiella desulfatans]
MNMKKKTLFAMLSVALLSGLSMADDMVFVPIGDAGNSADTTGYGAVGYEFQISQTEVSYHQWQDSGIGGGNSWVGTLGTEAPAASVTWHQAARYCNWLTSGNADNGAYTIGAGDKVTAVTAHNGLAMDALVATHGVVYVLPTEDEWYKAAYYTGSGYSLFANGTSTAPVQGVDSVYGGVANPEEVGFGTAEQSGTFNMMGNVMEWTEDATSDGSPLNLGDASQNMALRGGGFNSYTGIGFGDAELLSKDGRFAYEPYIVRDAASNDTGFRVVAIPEPGTISLMSLSTVGLFLTRTIRRRKRFGSSLMPIRRTPLCDSFVSAQEFQGMDEEDALEDSYFAELSLQLRQSVVDCINSAVSVFRRLDMTFWNRMVVVHERRVERRRMVLATIKKKALHGFDEFLALIMK